MIFLVPEIVLIPQKHFQSVDTGINYKESPLQNAGMNSWAYLDNSGGRQHPYSLIKSGYICIAPPPKSILLYTMLWKSKLIKYFLVNCDCLLAFAEKQCHWRQDRRNSPVHLSGGCQPPMMALLRVGGNGRRMNLISGQSYGSWIMAGYMVDDVGTGARGWLT